MFLFPYNLVEKGSRVVLYGAGDVGKDFYIQIHLSGYCNMVVWVDKLFQSYKVSEPFDYVENITKYDFDSIIIAVADYTAASEIENSLVQQGIKKESIVWSHNYSSLREFLPVNKSIYLNDFEFYQDVFDKSISLNDPYFRNGFYQDYSDIGLNGKRNNDIRINLYRVGELLNKECEVFNIGCNTGFFDLKIAKYVKHVTSVDIEEKYIELANIVKNKVGIRNVDFYCADAFRSWDWGKYDAIFLLAVHTYIINSGVSCDEFIDVIYNGLNDQGFVFFESLNLRTDKDNLEFYKMCELFENKGLKKIEFGNINSYGNRNFMVLKRS